MGLDFESQDMSERIRKRVASDASAAFDRSHPEREGFVRIQVGALVVYKAVGEIRRESEEDVRLRRARENIPNVGSMRGRL